MKKLLPALTIIFLTSCSGFVPELVEHKKLSVEVTDIYFDALSSLGVCHISRPTFKRNTEQYSIKVEYKLCRESSSHVVDAPLTGLLYSIDIKTNNADVAVERWQFENKHYKEFQELYLEENGGEIHDALLVIKKDVQNRREVASSNGYPTKYLDTLVFTFTEKEEAVLANRMKTQECDINKPCIQL